MTMTLFTRQIIYFSKYVYDSTNTLSCLSSGKQESFHAHDSKLISPQNRTICKEGGCVACVFPGIMD